MKYEIHSADPDDPDGRVTIVKKHCKKCGSRSEATGLWGYEGVGKKFEMKCKYCGNRMPSVVVMITTLGKLKEKSRRPVG